MRADRVTARRATRSPHSPGERLERALLDLADGYGCVVEHRIRSWASITFAGTRHTLTIRFDGEAAVAGAETLIAELPDHEFTLTTYLVADAKVREVIHTSVPEPRLTLTAELLLLEEA